MNQSDQTGSNLNVDLLNLDVYETSQQHQDKLIYVPNSIDFYSAIVFNDFMNHRVVEIQEGDVIHEGYLNKYKLYVVRTKRFDGEYDTEVQRRFSDFEWLQQELINKYGGYIIPSLPEKYLLTKINFESFEFSEKRKKELQNFLQKLLNHKHIRFIPELRIFIQDKEKFISLLKGELEQNKTFEQKYDNIVSSVKGIYILILDVFQQDSFLILLQLICEIARAIDSNDGSLKNNETLLVGLSMKSQKLKVFCTEHIESLKEEARILTEQQDHLIQWDGLGPSIGKDSLEPFTSLIRLNTMKAKTLFQLARDIEVKLITPLHQWITNTDAALQTCERRRSLIKELVIDQQRIEEIKQSYQESNARRDIVMDILKTKYQKNKDKSEKMSMIMSGEMDTFTVEAHEQFKGIVREFQLINAQNGRNLIKIQNDSFSHHEVSPSQLY